jgi:hypothetical protein
VYAFDTGFVCFARGWDALRAEDYGVLWEHVVLEALAAFSPRDVLFWRDKSQREVDFVVPGHRGAVDAFECKWRASAFSPRGLLAFRAVHPRGRNFLVVPRCDEPHERTFGELTVKVIGLTHLRAL